LKTVRNFLSKYCIVEAVDYGLSSLAVYVPKRAVSREVERCDCYVE